MGFRRKSQRIGQAITQKRGEMNSRWRGELHFMAKENVRWRQICLHEKEWECHKM
jgi:hypothetical protein